MIHGGGPGATGWSNFAPNVAVLSRKYRCIAVTMPGWGESSPQSLETGRDEVEAMKQLADELGIDKAAFVGNSMGGATSVRFTAEYPDRVSHLITMGVGNPAGVNILQPAGMSEGIRILTEAYEDPSPQNMKRLVRIMCFDPAMASDELAEERSATARRYSEHNQNWLDLLRSGPPMALPAATLAGDVELDRADHADPRAGRPGRPLRGKPAHGGHGSELTHGAHQPVRPLGATRARRRVQPSRRRLRCQHLARRKALHVYY